MTTLQSGSQVWRFGVFELDASNLELRRNGVPVRIRGQPFRVLVFLVEHAGQLVSREDLRGVLWTADTFVDFDHGLNTAMMKLRDALGDVADAPVYIETIPKRGYRFVAPVSRPLAPEASPELPQPAPLEIAPLPSTPIAASTSRFRHPVILALAFILLLSMGVTTWLLMRRTVQFGSAEKHERTLLRTVPITSAAGDAMTPVFSPDGREIAFVWDGAERNGYDVYVQLLGEDQPLRLTYGKRGLVGPPAWSPDGREVAFERCDGRNDGVFVISALGGTERKLASVTCFYTLPRPVAWMSSGNEILMVDRCQPGKPFDLVSLSLATGARHCLSSLGADQSGDSGDAFAISPDGTTVAFLRTTASLCCDLYKMPVTGGAVTRVISAGNRGCNFLSEQGCSGIMWTSDGQSLVFVDDQSKLGSLLRVSADGGSTERETGYPAIGSLTRDAARFVYAQRSMADPPSIWEAKFSSAGGSLIHQGKVISSQYPELDAQPSPDGTRLVWMSMRTGGEEIFVSDINGQNQVRLTHFDRYSGTPRWSPDSKSIAFDSYELGKRASVFLIDPDGRNLREVISAAFDCVVPSWSHDGHSIYYSANHDGVWQVWKHNLDTGADKQLTRQGAFDALESTDGKTVYYTRFYEPGIWKVPAGGGAETLVVHDLPQIGFWGHYAVTDDGIYFLDYDGEPHSVINFYRFNTGKITPVLTLAERPARLQPSLSASADGKALYFTQYDRQGVIKMMEFAK